MIKIEDLNEIRSEEGTISINQKANEITTTLGNAKVVVSEGCITCETGVKTVNMTDDEFESLNLESLEKIQGEDLRINMWLKALENEVILLKRKITVLENKTVTLKYNDIKDILIEGQKRETYSK